MGKLIRSLIFLSIFSITNSLFAQERTQRDGVTTYLKFVESERPLLSNSIKLLASELSLEEDESFILHATVTDVYDMTHETYHQFYRDIKVEHGTYKVHAKSDRVHTINGDYFPVSGVNTSPGISEEEALRKALEYINAKTYMWQSETNEEFAKKNEPAGTFKPKGELVIIRQFFEEDKKADLAYKFNIYAQEPLSRDLVYVNAHSGNIAFRNPIIKNCFQHHKEKNSTKLSGSNLDEAHQQKEEEPFNFPFVPASAATRYSGIRTIQTTAAGGGGHWLRDNTRGGGINTYNLNSGSDFSFATDFIDDDNNWTSGEWNNVAKDNAALDAQWGSGLTYDYFLQRHSRNSFDGFGGAINSFVHLNVNEDNAFWDGSRMLYGDGSARDAWTSLDICAHEVAHGVCTHTANLIYQGESGALNEGFSDIWSACVIDFGAPEKNLWLLGDEISGALGPFRNMSNPKELGSPDTYQGTNWITDPLFDFGGVHFNSGVFNYCFFLTTQGGTGTNDNGDSYVVNGIGFQNAANIFYRAESVYLTDNSNFAAARNACVNSAIDIYGNNSNEVCVIRNAFYAVGVGEECSPVSNDVNLKNLAHCANLSLTGEDLTINHGIINEGSPATGTVEYQIYLATADGGTLFPIGPRYSVASVPANGSITLTSNFNIATELIPFGLSFGEYRVGISVNPFNLVPETTLDDNFCVSNTTVIYSDSGSGDCTLPDGYITGVWTGTYDLSAPNYVIGPSPNSPSAVVPAGSTMSLSAGKYVDMVPGFRADSGSVLTAFIEDCANNNPLLPRDESSELKVHETNPEKLKAQFINK